MRTRGAVLLEVPGRFEVVELEVDDPRPGEVRVQMVATGLCHSDDHHATGDQRPAILPFAGGHEGAGFAEGGDIPIMKLVLYQKRLQGSLFGASAHTAHIPPSCGSTRRASSSPTS